MAVFDVDQQVALVGCVVVEAFAAEFAGVGFLTGVDPAVAHQVRPGGEGFPALGAGERLLPGVDPRVDLQVALRVETLPAHLALLSVLVGVQVTRQALRRVEVIPAHAAELRLVPLAVIQQGEHRVERQAADLTRRPRFPCRWTLPATVFRRRLTEAAVLHGVDEQVALQGCVVVEAAAAHCAGVWFLPSVDPAVAQHVGPRGEALPTLAADKRFLSRVDPHVDLQAAGAREALPTDFAALCLHVRLQVCVEALLAVEALAAHTADILGMRLHVVDQRHSEQEGSAADFAADLSLVLFGRVEFRSHWETRKLNLQHCYLFLLLLLLTAAFAFGLGVGPPFFLTVSIRAAR